MNKPNRSPFLEQVRQAVRVRHYSIRTEQAYLDWAKRYIIYHGKKTSKWYGYSFWQEQLGHRDMRTTRIYALVLQCGR